jgi:hypothetical protein
MGINIYIYIYIYICMYVYIYICMYVYMQGGRAAGGGAAAGARRPEPHPPRRLMTPARRPRPGPVRPGGPGPHSVEEQEGGERSAVPGLPARRDNTVRAAQRFSTEFLNRISQQNFLDRTFSTELSQQNFLNRISQQNLLSRTFSTELSQQNSKPGLPARRDNTVNTRSRHGDAMMRPARPGPGGAATIPGPGPVAERDLGRLLRET